MRFPLSRRHICVSALALGLFVAWGCGGKKDTPVTPPPPSITQKDADDIVQQIGIMVSADNGGWFSLIESMSVMLPGILQNSQPFTGGRARAVAEGLPRPVTLQDTTTTKAGVTYAWSIFYFNAAQDSSIRPNVTTEYLEARILAEGGTLNAGGVNATSGLFSDQLFQIYNLDASNDTLRFSSVMDDSSYGAVTSTITTNSTRIWYQQNFVDYELTLLKSQVGSPYAIKGEANWIIDASVMALPPSRTNVASNALGEGHLILDGTQNAVFEVTDSFGVGTTVYRYHLNLKTGAITRM
jgi:hypothetical protein